MFKHFLDAFPGVPAVTFIVKGDSPTTQPNSSSHPKKEAKEFLGFYEKAQKIVF